MVISLHSQVITIIMMENASESHSKRKINKTLRSALNMHWHIRKSTHANVISTHFTHYPPSIPIKRPNEFLYSPLNSAAVAPNVYSFIHIKFNDRF